MKTTAAIAGPVHFPVQVVLAIKPSRTILRESMGMEPAFFRRVWQVRITNIQAKVDVLPRNLCNDPLGERQGIVLNDKVLQSAATCLGGDDKGMGRLPKPVAPYNHLRATTINHTILPCIQHDWLVNHVG